MTEYIEQGYNHSGWLSDDGQYYYLGDETTIDIKIVDVSDLSNMSGCYDGRQLLPYQIPHNVYPRTDCCTFPTTTTVSRCTMFPIRFFRAG